MNENQIRPETEGVCKFAVARKKKKRREKKKAEAEVGDCVFLKCCASFILPHANKKKPHIPVRKRGEENGIAGNSLLEMSSTL